MSKQKRKTEDKCNTEKTLGFMQKDYSKEIPQYVFHLFADGFISFKSSNGSSMAEGGSWGIPEVRFEGATPTMFSVQYSLGRERSCLLPTIADGNRPRSNGTARKRQTDNSKGRISISKPNIVLPKDFGRIK